MKQNPIWAQAWWWLQNFLSESVVDDIDFLSWLFEMWANLNGSNAKADGFLSLRLFVHILREHILRAINILDEFEVVHLIVIATVAVFPDDKIVDLRVGWHQIESLEHSQELTLRDVQLLGTVEVLEPIF